ncbi:MAG TPA: hypothetical protein PKD79_04385, partial [Candidatus Doudnabacteria bacterium]|nr:hypothetical protein [Candidatus Doudnabacteria bacterium]
DIIKTKIQALSTAIQKVGASMYQQQPAAEPSEGPANAEANTGGDKPVDAEYKEVPKDDQKK